jgi:hypothetical protein
VWTSTSGSARRAASFLLSSLYCSSLIVTYKIFKTILIPSTEKGGKNHPRIFQKLLCGGGQITPPVPHTGYNYVFHEEESC